MFHGAEDERPRVAPHDVGVQALGVHGQDRPPQGGAGGLDGDGDEVRERREAVDAEEFHDDDGRAGVVVVGGGQGRHG